MVNKDHYIIRPSRLLQPQNYVMSIQGLQLWQVKQESPFTHKTALEEIARYFRKEFGYDFRQFVAREPIVESATQAFLILEAECTPHSYALGGFCLRHRQFKNSPPAWALQWIWLHPYKRGQGIFKLIWPFLTKTYGENLYIEGPLSKSMQQFVVKYHPTNFDS